MLLKKAKHSCICWTCRVNYANLWFVVALRVELTACMFTAYPPYPPLAGPVTFERSSVPGE